MSVAVRDIYIVIVGLLLIISGAWFYQEYAPRIAQPFNTNPVECNGTTYGVSPSYLGTLGEGRALAHYNNGTIRELGRFTWRIQVVNDACSDNYASVIIKTSNSPVPSTYNVTLDRLSSVLIAGMDQLVIYGKPSGALTGLGPRQAYQVDLQPRIVAGGDQGSYYYEFTSYYFDKSSGLLVRIQSQRILGYSNTTSSPDYMVLVDTVKDVYTSTGPDSPLKSYNKAASLEVLVSLLSGLYIVAGFILLGYAAYRILL